MVGTMNIYLEYMELAARRESYRTNHVLHLLISIISVGIWVLPWLIVSQVNAVQRAKFDSQIARMLTGK